MHRKTTRWRERKRRQKKSWAKSASDIINKFHLKHRALRNSLRSLFRFSVGACGYTSNGNNSECAPLCCRLSEYFTTRSFRNMQFCGLRRAFLLADYVERYSACRRRAGREILLRVFRERKEFIETAILPCNRAILTRILRGGRGKKPKQEQ